MYYIIDEITKRYGIKNIMLRTSSLHLGSAVVPTVPGSAVVPTASLPGFKPA
ncbi:MAG: hypothetical protein ABIG42_01175 [bacterium]